MKKILHPVSLITLHHMPKVSGFGHTGTICSDTPASLYSGGTNNGSKHISEGSLNDVRPLADEGQYITG